MRLRRDASNHVQDRDHEGEMEIARFPRQVYSAFHRLLTLAASHAVATGPLCRLLE